MHSTSGAKLFHGGSDHVLLLSHTFWADLAFADLELSLFFQEANLGDIVSLAFLF